MKAAEAEEVGEENLNGAVGQGVAISAIWAIAAETSKAVPRKELSIRWTMDDRLVRNNSSVILSKTWNLNKPLRREAVVFTIQTAGHSLKRNATVGGRYHSYKTTWRRRTLIQRQSQSTVMAQEKIAAELMNVEHPTGKMTSGILMRKQSVQSRSIWSKGRQFRATPGLSCLQVLEQRTTTSPGWWNSISVTQRFMLHVRLYAICREANQKKNTSTRRDKYSSSRTNTHTSACMQTRRSMGLSLSLSLSLSLLTI